ncbi:MAG: beta-glucosidase BglX [Bacteroidota bacterium]|nr:beta-glucosidase BglX [Bacteroidota bacterium]
MNEVKTGQGDAADVQIRIDTLIADMTLDEKIGQLQLVSGDGGSISTALRDAVAAGGVGAILNEVDAATVRELQRIAAQESRLGIPLLVGRDVIHGFETVFPIPLGQAATWNPDLIQRGAAIAAREAVTRGVNWTFAPMVDIGRDPRWGRIAETLGEDPYLTGVLAAAMVRGFQGNTLSAEIRLAACPKHFAGYGASESGRDYNTTSIPEIDLRNIHLPPFKAALDAGAPTIMTSFSDVNGIPATANEFLLRRVLREEWRFDGFVVSDWESVSQLSVHGLTADDREAAFEAAHAGVDMEMASTTFAAHIPVLLDKGRLTMARVDAMVANILRIKFRMGLFPRTEHKTAVIDEHSRADALLEAHATALQSLVLLKNDRALLPLSADSLRTLAVIGPLADDPYEQLGTWIFDGDVNRSRTPLQSISDIGAGRFDVRCARGLETTRSRDTEGFDDALRAARASDAVLLFLGEESILSGEAHCRADIRLPGAQEDLIHAVRAAGKPVVLIILAGRPLALETVLPHVDALLYAWHPGSMGGPAIADVLFGKETPSGRLPVTFPRVTGQIPIYYAQKNTGRPATPESIMHIDSIPVRAPQISFGLTSFHLDAGASPLFPFGYGLSYTTFRYSDIEASALRVSIGDSITIRAQLTNTGSRFGTEIAQLYVRDLVGSVTRPVRELKGFQRVHLHPDETRTISFTMHTDELAFHARDMQLRTEPGLFHAWIGGDSNAELGTEFEIF